MLPPSSPQFNPQSHQSRDSLSAYSNPGRDGSTPSTKHSSMSISSMLGTEPAKPREVPVPTLANGSTTTHALPTSIQHSAASSPTKSHYGNESRYQNASEIQTQMPGSINRFRAYSGGAPSSARASIKSDSPLHSKFNRLSSGSLNQISPTSDLGPSQDWRIRQDRHSDPGRLLERPSSQPSGLHSSVDEINRRNLDINSRQANLGRQRLMREELEPRRIQEQGSPYKIVNHQSLPEPQSAPPPMTHRTPHSPSDDRMHASSYPFLSNPSVFSEPGTSGLPFENGTNRFIEQKGSNIPKGPWGPEALRRIRDERLGTAPPSQSRGPSNDSRPRFLDALDDRQLPDEQKYPQAVLEMERSESLDRAIQSTKDGENGHRNSLALMLEHNRRAGRLSPLPQAVQGAQGQTHGPSRDPSIKNEFSKMFAGIGSGVSSSGLAGSGASTPFPPSPKQNDTEQRLPFSNRNDLIETHPKSRNGSRMGNKRSRKSKDDDVKEMEGSGKTEGGGGKGGKRVRHHHHAPVHQCVNPPYYQIPLIYPFSHHHYRIDEQTGTPIRVIGDPAATNHHHHHHPDGTIHYHTHSKPSSSTPSQNHQAAKHLPPPRIPKTTIDNTAILSSISHLPRHHLGSVLYSPSLSPPDSSPPASSSSKLPYVDGQFAIPARFLGRENCTIAVRIPRFYLTSQEREAVCQRRAVWGTEVYTDDTDPLAACIHAGWMQGSWGADIDISSLEITPFQGEQDLKANSTTTASLEPHDPLDLLPITPQKPPLNKDLHLTLLILPALKSYTSTIRHGIKSRSWGSDHDGGSYMIKSMRWVDERAGRGEERGGGVKKARIKALNNPLRIGPADRGGGVRLSFGAIGAGGAGPAAVATAAVPVAAG